jgi:hypothetical protein
MPNRPSARRRSRVRTPFVLLVALALSAPVTAWPGIARAQAPNLSQSRCIAQMTRQAARIARLQGSIAGGCLKFAARGKTANLAGPGQDADAQACLANDVHGKLAKADVKVRDKEGLFCLAGAEQLPDFGFGGADALLEAALGEPRALVADLFGADLSASVVDFGADRAAAKCQDKLLKDATKFFDALWKETFAAVKFALLCSRDRAPAFCAPLGLAPVTSAEQLGDAVDARLVADVAGKLAKKADKFARDAAKKCYGAGVEIAAALPGLCSAAADATALGECLAARVAIRQCRTINAALDLTNDCGDGPAAMAINPSAADVTTRNTRTLTLELDAPAGPAGFSASLVSDNPSLVSVPASVAVAPGETSATFLATTSVATGSATVTASAPDIDDATADVTVGPRSIAIETPLVGLGRTVTARLVLDEIAPSGGAMFVMSVDDEGVAVVDTPVVTVPSGELARAFGLTGIANGATILHADGSADGYAPAQIGIETTDRLVDVPTSQTLAMGIVYLLPVLIAPDPAPAGGFAVRIETSDAALVEVLTPVIAVPEGTFLGIAQIRALAPTGSAVITASVAGHAPDEMAVTLEDGLQVVESFSELTESSDDEVFVRLVAQGQPVAAPAGGATVLLASDDPDCASVPTSVTIAEGELFTTATLTWGGVAATPCNATVTASSVTYGADTVAAVVGGAPDLGALTVAPVVASSSRLGGGLQAQFRVVLPTPAHGGVLLQIESSDPSVALVAPDDTTPGAPVLEIAVPDATSTLNFQVQGVAGVTEATTISARQGRFVGATTAVVVVPGSFDLLGLITSYAISSTDTINPDGFQVRTVVPDAAGTAIHAEQAVAPTAEPFEVTLASSNPAVAEVADAFGVGSPQTVTIGAGQSRSAAGIGTGGVELRFDAPITGTTTVSATAPGFDAAFAQASAVVDVDVTQATITLSSSETEVGAGLEGTVTLVLSGASHGGVTVHVASSDPSVLKLAPDATTAGAASIDMVFPDGDASETFRMLAVAGATGSVTITATEAAHTSDMRTIDVVTPALDIIGVTTSVATDTASVLADDPFQVRTGLPSSTGSGIVREQEVNFDTGPLTVTVAGDDTAVARLTDATTSGASATTTIAAGQSRSPASVAAGGIALVRAPTTGGATTLTATAPDFATGLAISQETVTITVNPATLTLAMSSGRTTVGAGLQEAGSLLISGSAHGGVTVRVASSDVGRALVSDDAGTVGAAFVDLVVPDGSTTADFFIQGVAGAAGAVTLTATHASFVDDDVAVDIVTPALNLAGIITSHATDSFTPIAADPFSVRVGVSNGSGGLLWEQEVAAGAGPLEVTAASSNIAVAQVADAVSSAASRTVSIDEGSSSSPLTVAAGGVQLEFSPPTKGTTSISASAVGCTGDSENVDVTVDLATLTLAATSAGGTRIGAGLQQTWRITASSADHGGVTVHVQSDDPSVLTLAETAGDSGSASLVLALADGQTVLNFVAYGVAAGSATMTVSQASFAGDMVELEVEAPNLQVLGVTASHTTSEISSLADDVFNVRCGLPSVPGGSGIAFEQTRNADAGALTVTCTSSNTDVARVATPLGSGASAMAEIAVGSSRTPGTTAFRMELDPTVTGTTTVACTAPGHSGDSDVVDVTVDPATLTVAAFNNRQQVGAGLQTRLRITLNGTEHGGRTIRVATSDPARGLISLLETDAPTSFVDRFVADGANVFDVFFHGVVGALPGMVTVTGSTAGLVDGTVAMSVEEPVLDITGLAGAVPAASANDPFQVRAGVANAVGTAFDLELHVSSQGPLTVDLSTSDPSVGALESQAGTSAGASIAIAVGESRSPVSVATGGVAFDALAAGTTDVKAVATGFADPFPPNTVTVTVNP